MSFRSVIKFNVPHICESGQNQNGNCLKPITTTISSQREGVANQMRKRAHMEICSGQGSKARTSWTCSFYVFYMQNVYWR